MQDTCTGLFQQGKKKVKKEKDINCSVVMSPNQTETAKLRTTINRHRDLIQIGSSLTSKQMKQHKFKIDIPVSFLLIWLFSLFGISSLVEGQTVEFHVSNKCPFPIWPASAPNAGHPVIAEGGFFLPSGQVKHVQAPATWNGRFWARTACNFPSTSTQACQTGDCQGRLECNGTIGLPPATLVEVSLQEDKPGFYDISVVDGYNLPVSVSTKPFDPKCLIKGCAKSINSMCPQELQVLDQDGSSTVACKSACLAFNLDVFCCRNSHGKPDRCKPTMYSNMFKDACPSYISYAFDSAAPPMSCNTKDFVITFCPSKWSTHMSM